MKTKITEEDIKNIEPIGIPISICFTKTDANRWAEIKANLSKINKGAKLTHFARNCLREMMSDLEGLIEEYERKGSDAAAPLPLGRVD